MKRHSAWGHDGSFRFKWQAKLWVIKQAIRDYFMLPVKTCKTCGYRNKLNSHCTLNQLSKKVDDGFSCSEYKER